MKETHFSIGEVFRTGWQEFKEHWKLWIPVLAITFFLSALPNIGTSFFQDSKIAQAFFQILGFFISAFVGLGIINIALRIVKQKDVQLADFYNTLAYYWRYFFGQILFTVAITIGFILFIVPGIYLMLKYCLFPYYIIDKNMDVIDAFKASGRATFGSKWTLFGFILLASLVALLGALCLLIGLFVAIPVIAVAQAAIYKTLSAQVDSQVD